MSRLDGVSAIAVMLIASFAVDRIVRGILFLLSYIKGWKGKFPDPASLPEGDLREKAARDQKLVYFCIAAALAIPLIAVYGKIRMLASLRFPTNQYLDIIATAFILIPGPEPVT